MNNAIDNGQELLAIYATAPSATPNGFLALAEHEKLANGGNMRQNRYYRCNLSSLRLWQDTNSRWFLFPDELHALTVLGVDAISLNYKKSNAVTDMAMSSATEQRLRRTRGATRRWHMTYSWLVSL